MAVMGRERDQTFYLCRGFMRIFVNRLVTTGEDDHAARPPKAHPTSLVDPRHARFHHSRWLQIRSHRGYKEHDSSNLNNLSPAGLLRFLARLMVRLR